MGSPTQSVVDLTFSSDDDDVETEFEKVLKELVEEQPQEQEIRQKRGVGGSGQDNNEIVDLEENAQSTPERTALRSASHNRPTGSPEPSNSVTGTPKIGRSRQSPCILCKTHTVKSSPRQLSASRLRQSPRISEKEASKPLAVNQSTPPASKRSRVSTTDNEAATELTVKATAPRSAKRTSHGMSNDPKRSRSKSPTRLPQHSSSLHYDSVTEDDFDPLSGEDLVSCCWACTTRMCLPCGEPSLYAPHEHVTLGVLLCSVCAENVESIENSTDVYEKHSCCAGCACSEEDVTTEFYFCDSLGCERVFCRRCVAQAHGGASNGLKATAQISQSDSNWHCPACSPPTELVVLRQDLAHTLMEQLQRESRDETFLLKLFSDAIAEQDRCDSILDPSVRNSKSEDVTALDRIDLELWRLHDLRILDFIGRILEELDLKFSLTPAQCYKHVGQDKSGDLFNAPRPVWLCAADKEVDEHLQKRLKEPVVYTLPFEVYHTEQFDDVEDLGEDDLRKEDVTLSLRTGWAKISSVNATEAEVAAFTADLNLAYENEAVNHQVSIAVFTNDEQDQIDLCEEQRHVVTLAAHRDCEPRATPVESRRPSSGYRDERVNRPFSQRENVLKRDAVRKTYSDTFQDSQHQDLPLVLCGGQCLDQSHHIRTVAVAPGISKILKPHQSEGIKFMWRNCFLDFEENWEGNTDLVGGCVLAHSMGLGKSLSTVALLHTVMSHPTTVYGLSSKKDGPLIYKALLVVPVNTIANWENEFDKWQKETMQPVAVVSLAKFNKKGREVAVKTWTKGILLVSDRILAHASAEILNCYKPDLLVLDEAHTMLTKPANVIYQRLKTIAPKRRIALTGTPFQNDLREYFHIVNFVRPNILGFSSESVFDRDFSKPIRLGMAKNASPKEKYDSLAMSNEFYSKVEPFVHRVDETTLRKDLGPMQHVILHVRQTRMQAKIYQAQKRQQNSLGPFDLKKNFLSLYASLRPINFHPGSLLFHSETSKKQTVSSDDDANVEEWWRGTVEQEGTENVKGVLHGNKVVLLYHLLAYADMIGDKVVIFANSLDTLNYVEYALQLDWAEQVPNLLSSFPGKKLGEWRKGEQYFRIDGSVDPYERGQLVDAFESDRNANAFLLSKAGGMGINLTSANRIIILDQNFNPTVTLQAIFRVFRYGQVKDVFCYSLLTQGSMEEKVFGRCINKTGIALRVIDQKTIDLHFTHEELQDLTNTLNWVQCDRCDKWRVLSGTVSTNKLPEKWFCDMNTNDTLNNNCEEPEKTEAWYSLNVDVVKNRTDGFCDSEYLSVRSPRKQEKECNDAILAHLLNVSNNGEKNTPLICEHRYHDALLETTSTSTALEKARKEVLLIDAQCQKTERATGTAVSVYEGLLPLHSSPIDQKNSDTQCTTDKNTHAGTADKHPVVKSGTTSSKIGCWTPTAPINWEKKSDASLSDRFFPEMLIANETTSDSRNDAISIIDSSDDESTLFV